MEGLLAVTRCTVKDGLHVVHVVRACTVPEECPVVTARPAKEASAVRYTEHEKANGEGGGGAAECVCVCGWRGGGGDYEQ